MANVYEWLENIDPGLIAPPAPTLEPQEEDFFMGEPMDQIMPLDIDESGNMYFDMPRTMESSVRMTSGRAAVTVPEHLAEASGRILIYLTQVLEISEDPEEQDDEEATLVEEGTTITEEARALEPIDETEFKITAQNVIDGIRVNQNPKSMEIKDVIDFKTSWPPPSNLLPREIS